MHWAEILGHLEALEVKVGERSESDWKKYYGSSDEIRLDVKEFGKQCFQRTILAHTTKGQCNFEETRQLFLNNVLTEELADGRQRITTATSWVVHA